MDTLIVVLAMVGVAVLLLVAAVIADRYLNRRLERRLSGEGKDPNKPDAADAVIKLLDRTGDLMRQSLDSSEQGKGK